MAKTYTADIRPKFRDSDIACMKRNRVMLGEAAWMCDGAPTHGFADHGNARQVFTYLAGNGAAPMPPDGPWSQAWLDTYKAWMNDGFQI
ncbi:MAG: hypothetical protein WDM86_21545 [Rhizomicrobium sp.]